jgi:hypothetical protein
MHTLILQVPINVKQGNFIRNELKIDFMFHYLLCLCHILNTIKANATIIPQQDIELIQTNKGNDTVLSTRLTIVRSCGTFEKIRKNIKRMPSCSKE